MSVPQECTVLVIGGGPGGSYAASALAREGIDTVLLEYHVGESMLASIRHLLRFIELDETFDNYGFTKKIGAAFKLHPSQREAYTDFTAAGGPKNYAWNFVRSEADNLVFEHAKKCGASVHDNTKVTDIQFAPAENGAEQGRPTSVSYKSVSSGESGSISVQYIVDASGRAGLMSTKYLKTRKYNKGLNNVASWGYWKDVKPYSPGTVREGSPYFEALHDGSGWAWLIPLHNGTTSVGVVMNQDIASSKKKEFGSTLNFYHESLKLAPNLIKFLSDGELTTELKSASDYSYSASAYASPNVRIVGDAGCFIDPYFSSGVHLAMTSALSAATTISAVIRKDVDEAKAAKWHSAKVADSYTRFLLVVLSAYRQIRSQDEAVLSDVGEDNMDHAFSRFRPSRIPSLSFPSISDPTYAKPASMSSKAPPTSPTASPKTSSRKPSPSAPTPGTAPAPKTATPSSTRWRLPSMKKQTPPPPPPRTERPFMTS
ncbi:MAG: hypothetical protein Q9170_005838 [Blastenia crenularia]